MASLSRARATTSPRDAARRDGACDDLRRVPQTASTGAPKLRRPKLESAASAARCPHRNDSWRPADVITSMAAMDVSSVPRGSPADVALGSLDADVSRWRPADVARWLRGIERCLPIPCRPRRRASAGGGNFTCAVSRRRGARAGRVSRRARLLLRELDAKAAFPEELQPRANAAARR